ncbi:hypothetical protein HMPREF1210_01115 [Paenisporosarcina sp. HGH0030]|nr:hypothetical protein HMPREF1210_01115 [Paenisporosarcina sp. HGH0030]
MINISLEPIQEMLTQFIMIVVIFSMAGIVIKKLTNSFIGLLLVLSVLFIGIELNPSTYMNVLLSVLQITP